MPLRIQLRHSRVTPHVRGNARAAQTALPIRVRPHPLGRLRHAGAHTDPATLTVLGLTPVNAHGLLAAALQPPVAGVTTPLRPIRDSPRELGRITPRRADHSLTVHTTGRVVDPIDSSHAQVLSSADQASLPQQRARSKGEARLGMRGRKGTLPRSVQAGLYQHNQHTHGPTPASTLRKSRTVHPRSRGSQSERLSRPRPGQHTRTPPFGRPRRS